MLLLLVNRERLFSLYTYDGENVLKEKRRVMQYEVENVIGASGRNGTACVCFFPAV